MVENSKSENFLAAVVQTGSFLFDTPATLDRMAHWVEEARQNGAALAVFPEAYLGGYPKGVDFGARVGSRSPEGRELFRHYAESACVVPGPETRRIAQMAKAARICLVVGVIERVGGTLYCSALTFSETGQMIGHRRKVMPTAMERLIWGFGGPDHLDAASTDLGKIGVAICWENYMPLLRAHLYAQNVELYCAPTVDDRESWAAAMRMIAMEGRCFVLSASQYMRREHVHVPAELRESAKTATDFYDAIQGNAPETVLIRGGSLIVDPLGKILAGPVFDCETLLLAQIDRREILRGKFDFDSVGHYARPDLFAFNNRAFDKFVAPAALQIDPDSEPGSAADR